MIDLGTNKNKMAKPTTYPCRMLLKMDGDDFEPNESDEESDEESDSGYCDTCKSVEPLYKLQSFKQFHGHHCRDCYELKDEDDDEEDDESYIITVRMVRVSHQTSYKGQRYYHKLCMQMLKKC